MDRYTLLCCVLISIYRGSISKTLSRHVNEKVVGGQDAKITGYPYQVSLEVFGMQFCGGSIVSRNFVLTASHCIEQQYRKMFMTIRSGTGLAGNGGAVHHIHETFIHPQYNPRVLDYDVALVYTTDPFRYSDTTQPISIARSINATHGEPLDLSGWGYTSEGGFASSQLQAVNIPYVDFTTCAAKYEELGHKVTPRMLCAGTDGKDACKGDSGGPLASNNRSVQIGVVSWGVGCARKDIPGVFANLADEEIRTWIELIAGV